MIEVFFGIGPRYLKIQILQIISNSLAKFTLTFDP